MASREAHLGTEGAPGGSDTQGSANNDVGSGRFRDAEQTRQHGGKRMIVCIKEGNPWRASLEEACGSGGMNALIMGKAKELDTGIALLQLLQQ